MTSIGRRREQDDSGEYSDASQDIDHNTSVTDGGQHESDYDSQDSDSEHSDREQQIQDSADRRVDDDEDRSNPQYIPKRGTFYEHDDRTAASGEESVNTTSETISDKKEGSETSTERRRPPRKSEIIDKWSHDKFNENEQMPKSRDELVSIYGYDIRNEDAPPHARRNRRYGRGPNKYTRTWEDEEAYKRQAAIQQNQHRKPPNPEEFPDLDASQKISNRRVRIPRSKSQPNSTESLEKGSAGNGQLRRTVTARTPKAKEPKPSRNLYKSSGAKDGQKTQAKEKLPALENLTITTSVVNNGQGQRKVNAGVAQQRPVPTDQGRRRPPAQTQSQQTAVSNKSTQQPSSQPQQQKNQQSQQNHLQSQESPSGTEGRGGSRRYSSLRQRPLGDSYSPQQSTTQQQLSTQQSTTQQQLTTQQSTKPQPTTQQPPQQQPRYHADFPSSGQPAQQHQGSPAPQIHPQQLMHQVRGPPPPAQHGPSPPLQPIPPPPLTPQVRMTLLEQQQLAAHQHHSLHNLQQPHPIGQIQQGQGYAPPAMMPAQFMQQPSTQHNAVFGGAMYAQPAAPYPHQLYPHPHNYATQAGGVTYYSPVEQEQMPRPSRRPTAAIPIVRPANSSENDNIDRIVENMFVRKPWPASSSADASKEKSQPDNRNSTEPQSKESSQPNSLTSSSISTDSKLSENKEEKTEEVKDDERRSTDKEVQNQDVLESNANQKSIDA